MNVNDLNDVDGFQCPSCGRSLRVEELDACIGGEILSEDTIEFTPAYCPGCGACIESPRSCEMCGEPLRHSDYRRGGTFERPCWAEGIKPFSLCESCADKVQRFIVHFKDVPRAETFWEGKRQ